MPGGCVKFIGSEDDEDNDTELARIHISRWIEYGMQHGMVFNVVQGCSE